MMSSHEESWFSRGGITDPGDPHTDDEAHSLFADPDYCVRYLTFRRWPDGKVTCPVCGGANLTWLTRRRMWECRNKHPHAQFSVRSGTFMEDSRVALGQWLLALWLMAERNLAISSYELARRIGVTQKSAWLMIRRIRRALDMASADPHPGSGPDRSGPNWALPSGIF
jgi:hypothetical protein